MTSNPVTVKPDDPLQGCMALMAGRGFRHLPVLDAGKVVGVISIGDVVKEMIRGVGAQCGRPDGLYHEGRPRGLTDQTAVPSHLRDAAAALSFYYN